MVFLDTFTLNKERLFNLQLWNKEIFEIEQKFVFVRSNYIFLRLKNITSKYKTIAIDTRDFSFQYSVENFLDALKVFLFLEIRRRLKYKNSRISIEFEESNRMFSFVEYKI